MNNLPGAARTSGFATAVALVAGVACGPVAGVVAGFVAGLPLLPVAISAGLVVAVWLSPLTGVWLGVAVAAAVIGFVFGVIRKPPPGFGHSPAIRRGRRRWRMSLDPVVAWDPHAVTQAQEPRALPAPQEFHLHLHGPLTRDQLAEVAAIREAGYRAFPGSERTG